MANAEEILFWELATGPYHSANTSDNISIVTTNNPATPTRR